MTSVSRNKVSYQFRSKQCGFTLMELLAVIALLGVMLMMSLPLMQSQYYGRELEHAARQFIRHAQFARQYALYSGVHVAIRPLREAGDAWDLGWQIKTLASTPANQMENTVLARYELPAEIQIDAHRFRDPHTNAMQIIFNPAGAAKTKHGGFVANRLILSHTKARNVQRHIILAASGRWRICDPNTPSPDKASSC